MKLPFTHGGGSMDKIKIDRYFAALKMVEILFQKGLINQATYANIMRNRNSHISQAT